MIVSLYKNIKQISGGVEQSLESIYKGIRLNNDSNPWKKAVLEYRKVKEVNENLITKLKDLDIPQEQKEKQEKNLKKATKEKKGELPYFTVSGIFGNRQNDGLKKHSGRICIDIDGLKDDPLNTLNLLKKDKYTEFVSISCSGNGVFVVIKINEKDHERAFKFFESYFQKEYNIKIDYLADVSRPRFISYCPEAYYNDKSEVLQLNQNEETNFFKLSPIEKKIEIACDMIRQSSEGDKHKTLLAASNLLGGYVASGYMSYDQAQGVLEQEISKRDIDSFKGAQKTIREGLKFGLQSPLEIKNYHRSDKFDIGNYRSKVLPPNFDEIEEIEINVDEHKDFKNLPLINPLVYEKLPYPLNKLCQKFDGRERDIFLTSSISILSSCFSNIQGYYHNKYYFPNLFSSVFAPPASGKGAAVEALKFTKRISEEFKNEYEFAYAQYKNDVSTYSKDSEDAPIEPQEKEVYIAADNSAAQILIDVKNNTNGVLFETELKIVIGNQKQKWGDIRPFLLKAFGHELYKNKRKGDGKKAEKIEIEHPRISACFTGVPNDVYDFFEDSKSGLFSRFIFYCFDEKAKFTNPFANQDKVKEYDDSFAKASEFIYAQHKRPDIKFSFTAAQQQIFFEQFEKIYNIQYKLYGSDVNGVMFRLGLIVFRLAMLFTALRRDENDNDNIECLDEDFMNSLYLFECYFTHIMAIYRTFKENRGINKAEKKSVKNQRAAFFEAMKDKFTAQDMKVYAKDAGVSERTLQNYNNSLIKEGLVTMLKKGEYEKVR